MQRRIRTAAILIIAAASWACAARRAPAIAGADTVQVQNELSTKDARSKESNLADVIADAIRSAAKTDAAFLTASSLNTNTTIPKGTAGVSDILRAVRYPDDTVVIVKLTGAKVRKALEHGLSLYPQGNPAFLQVSGLTITIRESADEGSRVGSVKIGGRALENAKTYTVAMPSPLANGALAFHKVWDKTDIAEDTNSTLDQAVRDYLSGQKSLSGKSEERLVLEK